jgi:integrase
MDSLTIKLAAENWIENLRVRRRRPCKPATLKTFRSYLDTHIVPAVGDRELSEFGNAQMRDFVALLAAKDLSPKSIQEITSAVKAVVASVVNPQTGDQVYIRRWNAEFCDIPVVDSAAQRTPTLSRAQVEQAIRDSGELHQYLYATLAASGLRIGEALAIKLIDDGVGTFFDSANAAIHIRQSVFQGQTQMPKTPAAVRTVEIPKKLAAVLAQFAGKREGFLFGNGAPLNESTARKHLDKQLPGVGFHAFRRFRTTTLRTKRVPEDIIRFWLGHSPGSITDRYSKLGLDAEVRREWCERCGLGFSLPGGK